VHVYEQKKAPTTYGNINYFYSLLKEQLSSDWHENQAETNDVLSTLGTTHCSIDIWSFGG